MMLFVGDIHITSKHSKHILTNISGLIDAFPQESHIVFLGDYVYHFQYDRKALLQLFELFITLIKRDKTLYIVAGNHDRIAGHFIFEEARQTIQLINHEQLIFITKPSILTIEGTDCLFFPFFQPDHYPETYTNDCLPELQNETHPQKKTSRRINNLLSETINTRKASPSHTDRLLFVHHWYTADISFPGQKALFSYSSPALDPGLFLDDPDIRTISGHLHNPFTYKQYLCTGSIWHTSPLEINQQKYGYCLDTSSWSLQAHPLWYNTYLQLPFPENTLTEEDIHQLLDDLQDHYTKQLNTGQRKIHCNRLTTYDFRHCTLTFTSAEATIPDLSQAVETSLGEKLFSIKQKLMYRPETSLMDELDRAGLELHERFTDRKTLLKKFLEEKYGKEGAERYIQFLVDEQLL